MQQEIQEPSLLLTAKRPGRCYEDRLATMAPQHPKPEVETRITSVLGQSKVFVDVFQTVFLDESRVPTTKYNESDSQMDAIELNHEEILRELLRMNENKGYGPGELRTRVLRSLTHFKAPSLGRIFNLSLCTSKEPFECWPVIFSPIF